MLTNAATADDSRHRQADVAQTVAAHLKSGNRQQSAAIQRQRVHDFPDRQADAESRTAFQLDELGAGRLGFFKDLFLNRCIKSGPLLKWQSATVALDQIGTMLSPCSPRMSA